MKKLLILSAAISILLTFAGCSDSDDSYTSNYIYKNDSSQDITIKSYNYVNGDFLEDTNYSFVIPVGKTHTLHFDTEGGFPYPFMWRSPTGADYIVVSNGEKQFTNTRHSPDGEDKLFMQETYEITSNGKKKRELTCQYVFTDKDFENATPIGS